MNGPKLGRPPKNNKLYREQCLQEKTEAGERNAVESKFSCDEPGKKTSCLFVAYFQILPQFLLLSQKYEALGDELCIMLFVQ